MISIGWEIVIVAVIVLLVFGFLVRQAYQKRRLAKPEKQETVRCIICQEPMTLVREGLWLCVEHTLYCFRGEYYTHDAWKEMQEQNRKNYHTLLTEEDTQLFKNRENN